MQDSHGSLGTSFLEQQLQALVSSDSIAGMELLSKFCLGVIVLANKNSGLRSPCKHAKKRRIQCSVVLT